MDFELTDEQTMLRDMARKFAEQEIKSVIKEYDEQEKFPFEIVKKMASLGLCGTAIPQQYGGLGVDYVTHTLITEQLAHGSYEIAASMGGGLLPGTPIVTAGTETQKQKYLPGLCSGGIFCASAAEPNAGSDAAAIETTAVLDGDEWVINGNKAWANLGGVADVWEVLAQTDKSQGARGLALFIVEKGTPGIYTTDIKGRLGQRAGNVATIRLVDCRVPRENVIGDVGRGLGIALRGVEDMRLTIAAASVGMAQSCLDLCIEYAKVRSQFGRRIGSFQLVQGTLADMAMQIDAARYLTYHAAYLKDKKTTHRKEIAFAKLYATEMAVRVTTDALRLHGAYAYTNDMPIERCYRTAIAPTIYGGTSEIQRLTIGRELLDINAFT